MKKRKRTEQVFGVKEEQPEETRKPVVCSPAQSTDDDAIAPESRDDKDSLNLFLQKPGSFSKLSKLLEEAKLAEDSYTNSYSCYSAEVPTATSYPSHSTCEIATPQQGPTDKTDGLVPSLLKSSPWITCSPQSISQYNQLSKILPEKSSQWFSLFPRSPCDEKLMTSGSSPPASCSPLQTITPKSPSLSLNPTSEVSSCNPPEISDMQSSVLQVHR